MRLYCRHCEVCCRVHREKAPKQGLLLSFVAGAPWDGIHIDLTGRHPRSRRGNQYILTVVDAFTKFALGITIREKSGHCVARALTEEVFAMYGMPLFIISDLGREFKNQTMCEICRLIDVHKLRTTSYKPSTNGMVERFHQTLNSALEKVVNESQREWCERLPFILAAHETAYRASEHSSTGFSPHFLTFGREVRAPVDLVLGEPEHGKTSTDYYVVELKECLRSAYHLVRDQLGRTAERAKKYYDVRVHKKSF